MRNCRRVSLTILIATLISACGGGGNGKTDEKSPPPRTVDIGYIVQGSPNTPATNQLMDYVEEKPSQETVIEGTLGPVYASLAGIGFSPTATVNDINFIIDTIKGSIVASISNKTYIVVKFPAAQSQAELDNIIAKLQTLPAVDFAHSIRPMEADALPREPESDVDSLLDRIQHHLAVGAAAAWNAKGAITQDQTKRPTVLVLDYFGAQGSFKYPKNIGMSFATNDAFYNGIIKSPPETHGYHVLGILAGAFNATNSSDLPGDVTGMFPGRDSTQLPSVIVEMEDPHFSLYKALYIPRLALRLKTILEGGGNVVVNTSIGRGTYSGSYDPAIAELETINEARAWARLIRGGDGSQPSALESHYFHATAAGNNGANPALREAKVTSGWAATGLMTKEALGIAPFNNTVAVENRTTVMERGRVTVGPHTVDSNIHGNIAGIGCTHSGGIYSFTGPDSTGLACGTSMASPQVAGLAAYLWSLQPSLTSFDIQKRLIANGQQYPSNDEDVAKTPVIDAYATILTTDFAETPSEAPTRMSLLDVAGGNNDAGDGIFDENDLQAFINQFASRKGEKADYSKYDLNGDGFTGGDRQSRFNLDITLENNKVAGEYKKLYRHIETSGLIGHEMSFDENKLSDLDILCYYAYGPEEGLYRGNSSSRESILGKICTSRLIDIGPCDGNCSGVINNEGDVAGNLSSPNLTQGYYRAFYYSKGELQFISSAQSNTWVRSMNDLGDIILSSGNDSFIWSPVGGARNFFDLMMASGVPYISDPGFYAFPFDINNSGLTTGPMRAPDRECRYFPFLFLPSLMSSSFSSFNLDCFENGGQANALNNNGDTVGYYVVGDYAAIPRITTPFFYHSGVLKNLGTPGGSGWAIDINDTYQIVGIYFRSDTDREAGTHCFFYNEGNMIDIGVISSVQYDTCVARAINNKGQVVGHSSALDPAHYPHGFIWDSTNGMRDLNDFVSDDWLIRDAFGINDKGQIIAWAYYNHPTSDSSSRLVLITLPDK